MRFDMDAISFGARYKIISSTITPRPIAWVTTVSAEGEINCAPHSFFNAMGSEPPIITLGLMKAGGGGYKDTAANILATGEFTIGLVSEVDAAAMNLTSTDAPRGVNELALAGVSTLPATKVRPPIIASSPVSFECRRVGVLDFSGQTLIVGEILVAHIADAFVLDAARMHLDTPAMKLIARTHGSGWYQRGTDAFQMDRPSYADLIIKEQS